jgi:hypothetical protein
MGSSVKRSTYEIISSSQTTVCLLPSHSHRFWYFAYLQFPSESDRSLLWGRDIVGKVVLTYLHHTFITQKRRKIIGKELILRWLRKTGAFDKKLQSQTTPGDHHGNSNLGLGFNMPLGMGMGGGLDEDREGSPTPQSGRGKKRRGSADE